ncbi:hypothetical protein UVI_02059720 [Ustilaginoidea virens]|uniref:Uncharacterized protein n=1 Tax=Ustilaginoidea virens TaxID=1159556 RepID=A0A1B5L8D2_USTVR|nr:hypothetical protein UVI_02059720 [Ustilaginoidea virens]
MTLPSVLYASLVASFSSVVTIVSILVLLRTSHDNIITTLFDRVQSPSASNDFPQPRDSLAAGLTSVSFVMKPWTHPAFSRTLPSNESEFWDLLVPPSQGFIKVDMHDGKEHVVGIAMFHQLHCLKMMLSDEAEAGGDQDPLLGSWHQCRNATRLYEFLQQHEKAPVEGSVLGRYSVFH